MAASLRRCRYLPSGKKRAQLETARMRDLTPACRKTITSSNGLHAWVQPASITNLQSLIQQPGRSRGPRESRGTGSILRNRCTSTAVMKIITMRYISYREPAPAKKEGKRNEI